MAGLSTWGAMKGRSRTALEGPWGLNARLNIFRPKVKPENQQDETVSCRLRSTCEMLTTIEEQSLLDQTCLCSAIQPRRWQRLRNPYISQRDSCIYSCGKNTPPVIDVTVSAWKLLCQHVHHALPVINILKRTDRWNSKALNLNRIKTYYHEVAEEANSVQDLDAFSRKTHQYGLMALTPAPAQRLPQEVLSRIFEFVIELDVVDGTYIFLPGAILYISQLWPRNIAKLQTWAMLATHLNMS